MVTFNEKMRHTKFQKDSSSGYGVIKETNWLRLAAAWHREFSLYFFTVFV